MKITNKQINNFKEKIYYLKNLDGALLPALHEAHEMFGYIPLQIEEVISKELGIKKAKLHGVVTFYEMFHTVPTGKHSIGVCSGTTCHIENAGKLRHHITDLLGIKEGETSKDGLFTMVPIKCLGLCDKAPNMMIDDKIYSNVSIDMVNKLLKNI